MPPVISVVPRKPGLAASRRIWLGPTMASTTTLDPSPNRIAMVSAALGATASVGGTTTFQLPPDNGTADFVLSTDGSGITSWVTLVSGSGVLPPGYVSDMVLQWNSVTQVQIGAGSCRDSADSFDLALLSPTTITITTSGIGGVQTSQSESSNTWYKCLVIGDTSEVNATTTLLTPQGTAFSQTGYDVFRILGYVRNNSSSNLLRFTMEGDGRLRLVTMEEPRSEMQLGGSHFPSSANTFQTADLTSLVPENTSRIAMQFEFDVDSSSDTLYLSSGVNNQTVPGGVIERIGLGTTISSSQFFQTEVYSQTLDPTGPSFDWAASSTGNETHFILVAYLLDL